MTHYRRRARAVRRAAGEAMCSEAEVTEKTEQHDVCKLYQAMGCKVVSFSQPRATMQTEGIPDLKVYCERKGLTWWHEVKRPGGKQSDSQGAFQALVERCGEVYVLGGFAEAREYLRCIGVIPKQVA